MKKIALKSVRGSKTGRPIMVLLDLLGRRMALRIMWELSKAVGPMTFRDLQDAAETNPSVLNARLKELREARIISHEGEGYVLTETGHSLSATLKPLHKWAGAWAQVADD
ncbi:winged helix-turn-helix transcriptional regulator [Bradyrhizobium sp. UFLA01-814]